MSVKELEKNYYSNEKSNFCSHYVLHSKYDGILESIEFTDDILKNIFYSNIKVNKNDKINKFNGSKDRIGLCLLEYTSYDEMIDKVYNFDKYVKIKLKDEKR